MMEYRAYVIGEDGHFIRAVELFCPDDKAAIEQAKLLTANHAVELWQLGRRVAQLGRTKLL